MIAAAYRVTGPIVDADVAAAVRTGAVGNLLNLFGAARIHEMQRMAVEETRLDIPLLIGLDVLHGYETDLSRAARRGGAFRSGAMGRDGGAGCKSATANGIQCHIRADARRFARSTLGPRRRGPGEDLFVASLFARAKVKGFQGGNLAERIAATAKHFCAYGAVTAGREYASVDVSERTLREIYLPPFAAAVELGVSLVMPAFIDLAGIPMTANRAMLTGFLRGQLGFDGVIVSDDGAIAQLIHQGVAADLAEAASLALKAGVDIDLMEHATENAYDRALPIALERGLVSHP